MKEGKKFILIADDDPAICSVVSLLLQGEGCAVQTVNDGTAVVNSISPDIDLYLLDVNMPGLSGIEAAIQIRSRCDTPIIFLTAYSGESDKVMGFSAGADDYIVKPFSNMELLMRVRAVLRRTAANPPQNSSQISIYDAVLDTEKQCLFKNGSPIALTYTEFQILQLLASNKKSVFSPDRIYNHIWNDNAVNDSAIMVHIKNIRKKLGDDSRSPVYIKTAWGRGYYVD